MVFAKLARTAQPPAAKPKNAPIESPLDNDLPGRRFGWLDAALLAAFVGAAAMIGWRFVAPPPPARAAAEPEEPAPPLVRTASRPVYPSTPPAPRTQPTRTPERTSWAIPPTGLPPTRPAGSAAPSGVPGGLLPQDGGVLMALARAVSARSEIDPSLLEQAASLHARYPAIREVDQTLESALEIAASQASARGRADEAVRYREQAADLLPDRLGVWQRLIASHEVRRAWPDAERAAHRALSALPDASSLHLSLARALSQQARDDEAADVLRRRLTARNDPAARAMLAELETSLRSVAGMAHRSSSHFNVTFEGQADDALGRSLVQTLEEKYAMLSRTLDCEPTQEVPVILYSQQALEATGAPSWAGATFSHGDGRIRVGTRDLSAGFVPLDLERTLTHELTHAFVFGRTRGAISRDINEGLAQYLSGKRLGYKLDPARVAGSNQQVKVDDYYDSALSFVEYLIDHYRQASMNDLLKYTGETGSVDQGFRRAYHLGYQDAREEWIKSLRTGS